MSAYDLTERAGQGREVEVAAKTDGARAVVVGTEGFHLLKEPQTLLSEAGWDRAEAIGETDRRERIVRGIREVNATSQRGDGGSLKESAKRDVDAESVTKASHDLGSEKRVAAELEEVIKPGNGVATEDGGPDIGDDLFSGVEEEIGKRLLEGGRKWKGLTINLAAAGQR